MSLVTLTGVAKSHGAQHLFSDVSLQIAAGRRIAIVGANGAGKTTLLEIITGEQELDAGSVTRGRDAVIGYLRQEVAEMRGQTALAEVLAGADAVVVGNTGPAHLAAAVGTPVVSLFAPVVPAARWRPWGVPQVLLGNQEAPCK